MDKLISLLVFSTLSQLVVPDVVPKETSFRANIEMVSEHSSIFSGERARLRCSVPDLYGSTWSYLWFRGAEELSQTGAELSLWNAKFQDSGKYYCQGIRETKIGKIHTMQSLPVEIKVDGGWAILHVPMRPVLVGDTLKVTCLVRGNPPLQEIILYKDGVEVMRQNGLNPDIYMTNVSLEDQGMYSCRASWDVRRHTHSVISVGAHVQILEVLSQPILEISHISDSLNKMKLICHVQYNAPAPAPPINYYFYRNNKRLGPATSNNYDLVTLTPGQYCCKVRVPELDLAKWSEPKNFGLTREPQAMPPPSPRPRPQMPVFRIVSSLDNSLPPPTSPTATELSSDQPNQLTPEKSTASQGPPLKTSQAVPSTFLTTVQFFNKTTTPGPANTFQQPDNMSEESGDMPADPL